MVHIFLTSSPTGPLDGSRYVDGIDKWNGFADRLHRVWPQNARCLMIAAAPDNYVMMDEMTGFFWHTWLKEGFSMQCMDKLDYRWQGEAIEEAGGTAGSNASISSNGGASSIGSISSEELHGYDVLFLAGGHVPIQRRFFQQIGLREKVAGFQGIIIGISAGSMNSADMVYIQLEEPGEAADSSFCRWGSGLGLTERNILPHYQMVKNNYLDGQHLFEDITIPDSHGHEFIVLCDGSYLYMEAEAAGARPEKEAVYGEAYIIKDGNIQGLCGHEQELIL